MDLVASIALSYWKQIAFNQIKIWRRSIVTRHIKISFRCYWLFWAPFSLSSY